MPILTSHLRSPHQRRQDQLTILKRRSPPPKSAGRFFKIVAETVINKFDPAFDSDADTDGPTSASSLWRTDLARVRSGSSAASVSLASVDSAKLLAGLSSTSPPRTASPASGASVASASSAPGPVSIVATPIPPNPPTPSSTSSSFSPSTPVDTPADTPVDDSATPVALIENASASVDGDTELSQRAISEPVIQTSTSASSLTSPVTLATLTTTTTTTTTATSTTTTTKTVATIVSPQPSSSPASSFDGVSDAFAPFSRDRARSFYGCATARSSDENAECLGPLSETHLRDVLDDDYELFIPPTRCGILKNCETPLQTNEKKNNHEESRVCVPRSNTPPSGARSSQKESKHDSTRTRSSATTTVRLSDSSHMVTLSIVTDALMSSDEEDTFGRRRGSMASSGSDSLDGEAVADLKKLASHVSTLVSAVSAEDGLLGAQRVPLFVEEIGRTPRAAIVDGKVRRVKMSVEGGSFRMAVSERQSPVAVMARSVAAGMAAMLRFRGLCCWRLRKRKRKASESTL